MLGALCDVPFFVSLYREWHAQGDASSLVDLRHSRVSYTISVILYRYFSSLANEATQTAVTSMRLNKCITKNRNVLH